MDQRAEAERKSSKHYCADHKQRCDGFDADSGPPLNALKWTVDKDWKPQGNEHWLQLLHVLLFTSNAPVLPIFPIAVMYGQCYVYTSELR